jgi:hypothetical protein
MGQAIAYMVFKNGKESVSTNYKSLLDIPAVNIDGQKIERLGQILAGKRAILVVNVATQ